MLTRLLFTFAALALPTIFAAAKDIPAELAPPREHPLVGTAGTERRVEYMADYIFYK